MNKLKFKFGNGAFEFEVEGDDDFVKEKTEWATSFVSQTKDALSVAKRPTEVIDYAEKGTAINTYSSPIHFLLEKKFASETDITLALAYYLEVCENKECWTADDIKSQYSVAKRKLPSNVSMNISLNMSKGFAINPNRDDKRSYCLTHEGKEYIDNYVGKGGDLIAKTKAKKNTSKQVDADEQAKIDEIKSSIAKYDQNHLEILEKIKGQKDQTLLAAFIIRNSMGEDYEFTPRILAALIKKLGISLDPIQIIKMISINSKCFDSERRGWYTFNEIGCKVVKGTILYAGE